MGYTFETMKKQFLPGGGYGSSCCNINTYLDANNKSGVATKYHLLVGASVVDADYQGEVHLNVHNTGNLPVTIFAGQKLVQFIHKYYINTDWQEISNEQYNEIQVSDRGAGGFGSSGIN